MSASRSRPGRFVARLALALASGLALVALLELGTRVWLWGTGEPWDAGARAGEVTRIVSSIERQVPTRDRDVLAREDEDAEREILHPYFGFDAAGMRAQILGEVELSRRARGFDLFVGGGSVSALFVGEGSSRAVDFLRDLPDFPPGIVRVLHEGRGAYKEPQQANALAYALSLGVQPEFVVVIDGFNDVAIAAQNATEGTHPLYPWGLKYAVLASNPTADPGALDALLELRRRQQRVRTLGHRILDWGLTRSALAATFALRSLHARQAEVDVAFRALAKRFAEAGRSDVERGPRHSRDLDAALRTAVRAWAEGARSMWALCRARDIPYLHVLQPNMLDPGSKPLTPEEVEAGRAHAVWVEAARLGYPLLRAAGEELAREGVPFLDATRIFADVHETLYYDNCHFSDAGQRLLGEAIGARMRAALEARAR